MARTKKANPAKDADKKEQDATQEMSEKGQTAPQEPETAERDQNAPEPEGDTDTAESGDTPQGTQDEPEQNLFAGIPNPCVYCGPTVRGVARQYTTYQGGIPDALRAFLIEHPDALGLIVSTGKFPAMRKRLDTSGTQEAELYKSVKARLR